MSIGVFINEILERMGVRVAFTPAGFQVLTCPTNDPFPRIMLHESVNGRGWPLVENRIINEQVLEAIARFNFWCVSPIDLYDLYPRAIQSVRSLNPKIRILAHVLGPIHWPAQGDGWAARLYRGIGNRSRDDYANLDEESVVEVLAAMYTELLQSGLFDGLMLDNMAFSDTWRGYQWMSSALDADFRDGKGQLLTLLRDRFPNSLIIANGGPAGAYAGGEKANGWWRENYPHQNGGFFGNITGPLGMLSDPSRHAHPPYSVISTTANPAIETERFDFALASSCLGEGVFTAGPGNFDHTVNYRDWWSSLYQLDRRTWLPVHGKIHGGWLGRPLGKAELGIDGIWRRQFVFGSVAVNPAAKIGLLQVHA